MFDYEIKIIKDWIERDQFFFDPASYFLKGKITKAEILLKSEFAIISGIEFIKEFLKSFKNIKFEFFVNDKTEIYKNTAEYKIGILEGDTYDLLILERAILNILSMMSGIATKTFKLTEKIKELNSNTKLSATRKVLPGIGLLQKLAVLHGGGYTHRFNLSEMIMLKDNHIKKYGGVSIAINKVRMLSGFTKKIEVEVENEEQAIEAMNSNVDIIMLDNFSPERAKYIAKKLKNKNKILVIEVSGGINEENYLKYVSQEVDVISSSMLTSNYKPIDFSIEMKV